MDISFLVKKAKDRDITAFSELYSLYSEDLYRFALYMLNNKEDAEDAVQETVITAFKSVGNLRDDSLFKSWLFKILSNQCKSQLKKNNKNPEILPEDDYIFLIEDESVSSESISQVIVALAELGISLTDSRFVKNGNTLLDALLQFRQDDGGFSHLEDSGTDLLATEQAFYALVAANRMAQGESSLYRMK